jgi:hypothetical protein
MELEKNSYFISLFFLNFSGNVHCSFENLAFGSSPLSSSTSNPPLVLGPNVDGLLKRSHDTQVT